MPSKLFGDTYPAKGDKKTIKGKEYVAVNVTPIERLVRPPNWNGNLKNEIITATKVGAVKFYTLWYHIPETIGQFGAKKRGCKCIYTKKPTRIGRFGNGENKSAHENLKEEKKSRALLNKRLSKLSSVKYKMNIPWGLISEAVMGEGFVMPMLHGLDDNKPGRINVQIGNKTWLAVQWYPFQNDTFEITAYAS